MKARLLFIAAAVGLLAIIFTVSQWFALPHTAASSDVSAGPIFSFDFDDGFQSAYANALPIFDTAGLKTTQYIITNYIGYKKYVTKEEVLTMQAHGHEIGAHTRTHPHLSTLPLVQAQNEIEGSKQDLFKLGIHSVTTFAYPYGDENPAVESLVKSAGFQGARITKPGFNDASTDPFALWYFNVQASTTLPQIEAVINENIAKKKWLILVFHKVDEPGNDYENVPHTLVQGIVDYVVAKHLHVVTNAEGLHLLPHIL